MPRSSLRARSPPGQGAQPTTRTRKESPVHNSFLLKKLAPKRRIPLRFSSHGCVAGKGPACGEAVEGRVGVEVCVEGFQLILG